MCAAVLAPRGVRSYMVAINGDGDVIDHVGLDWLHSRRSPDYQHKYRADKTAIRTFLEKHSPHVVGLGADSMDAKFFANDLSEILSEAMPDKGVEVELMPMDMARVFAAGRRSTREFPSFPVELRMAVSVARRMQAPEVEMAALFGPARDILCIQMHPLQQRVAGDVLYAALHREVMVAVNRCGVRVNSAVSRPHVAATLEFVCGLGPRKADLLLSTIRKHYRGRLTNRKQVRVLLSFAACMCLVCVCDGACVHACVRACVCACVRACVRVCVCQLHASSSPISRLCHLLLLLFPLQ